jgi:hypothetical protein
MPTVFKDTRLISADTVVALSHSNSSADAAAIVRFMGHSYFVQKK